MGAVEYNYKDLMFFLGQLCVSAAKLDPDDSEVCDRYARKVRELIEDLGWYVDVGVLSEEGGVEARAESV